MELVPLSLAFKSFVKKRKKEMYDLNTVAQTYASP